MEMEEARRKYDLARSSVYFELRDLFLKFIVNRSTSIDPTLTQGMLMLIKEVDSWEQQYISAVNKERN